MHFAIIAAGEGSRLAQEGVALPKPLVNLCGTPMIQRLIDIFLECGAESVSIIINNEMTQVREYVESLTLPVPLKVVVKSTPSSMHSFYEVSRHFTSGKFILTTVDTIFRPDEFKKYVEAFEKDDTVDGYMAVTSFIDDEKPLYIDVDSEMMITAFRDKPWEGVRYISGGIYGLTSPALRTLERCIETGVSRMRNYQRALVDDGLRLKAYPFKKIIDVDHQADIVTAETFLKE
ncbi:MAG: NTP transferase domain-containing protein [Bacteroidales bacterium]|nr:NTP transferase domain-containing protein [Bacteroidales bacterium]MBD5245206.1 NTP transferase domain-containing protein [Barnesiella sp.]